MKIGDFMGIQIWAIFNKKMSERDTGMDGAEVKGKCYRLTLLWNDSKQNNFLL